MSELPPAFRPLYLEQWECGAFVPVSGMEGVEESCGEVATRWLGSVPSGGGQHPRCDLHKDVREGLNLTAERCRARLIRGSRGPMSGFWPNGSRG